MFELEGKVDGEMHRTHLLRGWNRQLYMWPKLSHPHCEAAKESRIGSV